MAGNQSCEGKFTTLECMECGYREVFTEGQFKFTDGLCCNVCEGPVKPSITRLGEKINNRRMKKQDNTRSVGTLIVDIDCSEALKGLKAVQREAKRTVQALKEVEALKNRNITADDAIVCHAYYECLTCGHKEKVYGKKEKYQEIRVCPECNKGAFVDIWKINKYKD